jgi:hypothetical protein
MVYFDQGLIALFAATQGHACVCLSENSEISDGTDSNRFAFGTVTGVGVTEKGWVASAGLWKESPHVPS